MRVQPWLASINNTANCSTFGAMKKSKEDHDGYCYNGNGPVSEIALNPVEGAIGKVCIGDEDSSPCRKEQNKCDSHKEYSHGATPSVLTICLDNDYSTVISRRLKLQKSTI